RSTPCWSRATRPSPSTRASSVPHPRYRKPLHRSERVQFTYTPEQQELRDRAQRLTDSIVGFEEPCEQGRGLPDESLAEIRRLPREHELNAINMPAEWGGQGLPILEQVIVQERLG